MTIQVPEHICLNCFKEVQVDLFRFTPKKQGDIAKNQNENV